MNLSRYLVPLGLTASTVTIVLAFETSSPGFTIVALFVIAKVITGLVLASVWPLAFAAVFTIAWKLGKQVGHRDALQEVAAKTADRKTARDRWTGVN